MLINKKQWQYGILSDAIEKGSSNISQRKIEDDKGPYPVYGAKGVVNKISFYHQKNDYIAIIKDGAGIGRVTKHPPKSSILATMQYLLPKPGFKIDFIKYFLESVDFEKYRTGSTIPHIYFKDYKSIPFPLVSTSEQKRIVAILDEAFEQINQAKANAEQNLKNAREVFDSAVNSIFTEARKNYEIKTLGEALIVERGSSPRPIKQFVTDDDSGVHWIKIGDVKEGEKYITSTKEKITLEGAKKSRKVEVGDFVLSNSMSFGRPYIMKIQGYIHDGWFVFRLPEYINSDYLYYLLSSPYLKEQFHSLAAGAIVKNISGDLVKKAILPIPPMESQKEIADKIELLSFQVKNLESIYQQKIQALDELKQSLLQKAFSGELTNSADGDAA